MQKIKSLCDNNRGQGLIEYLILVALVAVASIGVLRSINHVVNSKFIEVDYALRGQTVRLRKESVDRGLAEKRDLSNFMRGAGTRDEE